MSQAIFGLLGVILGGMVTAFTTVWVQGKQRRAEAVILARSLRAEILALAEVVRTEQFEEQLDALQSRSQTEENWWYYGINANEDYFAVYHAHIGRLGLLTADQAEKVIAFYTLSKVWVENMRAGHDPTDRERAIERLKNNLELLKRIRQLGEDAARQLDSK